jgi:FMN phosphatase YigB (HAD superfamily)
MIGDDLECDVIGALKSGWRQVHFNPGGEQHREQIWRTVKNLKDLLDLPLYNPS